jgi:hypothetical protein
MRTVSTRDLKPNIVLIDTDRFKGEEIAPEARALVERVIEQQCSSGNSLLQSSCCLG